MSKELLKISLQRPTTAYKLKRYLNNYKAIEKATVISLYEIWLQYSPKNITSDRLLRLIGRMDPVKSRQGLIISNYKKVQEN